MSVALKPIDFNVISDLTSLEPVRTSLQKNSHIKG